MDDLESFLHYFERVRGRTMRVAQRIPAEAFETSPTGKGLTFGDLLRHLAETPPLYGLTSEEVRDRSVRNGATS